jgi:hypothetical protein
MCGVGRSIEAAVRSQLADLAFIDAREAELEPLFRRTQGAGLFGPVGNWGAVAGAFGDSSLGYFSPTCDGLRQGDRHAHAPAHHGGTSAASFAACGPGAFC